MNNTERLARMLCKRSNIDPDAQTSIVSKDSPSGWPVGTKYPLWKYWAEVYVKPILDNLEENHD